MRRRWALLLWVGLWVSCLAAVAQPPAPPSSPSSASPRLVVLVVDESGRWRVEQQERWVVPSGLVGVSSDWKAVVDTRPFRQLAYSDRLEILAQPEWLLSSSWAPQAVAPPFLLVLRPERNGRLQGRLFDLGRQTERVLVVGPGESEEPRRRLLERAIAEADRWSEPVLAHPEGVYHRASAAHLSGQTHYEPVESPRRAERFGWSPCGMCYPEPDRESLYDPIDHRLGQEVSARLESEFALLDEGPLPLRLQRVAQRVVRRNRLFDQGYRFEVLDTDSVNAYAAPTGPIYVTRGLLEVLESDDELAAVLGHELSHSERRHARRQVEAAQDTGVLGLMVTVATGFPVASLGTDLVGAVLIRGYGRGYELEADRDGMLAAYAAGYDPARYLLVQDHLERVQAARGRSRGVPWLRTHPRGGQRKAQLQQLLDQTEPLRQRLDALAGSDRGLSRALKAELVGLDTARLERFLLAYQRLLPSLQTSLPVFPEGTSPAVWESVEALLQGDPLGSP